MNYLPHTWVEMHAKIIDYLPDAILAGGSLRDWDNGRPVKDLDFFYGDGSKQAILKLVTILRETHYIDRERDLLDQSDGSQDGDNTIASLYAPSLDITIPDINLIVVQEPTLAAQLARFDFGICRIGCEYGREVVKTDEYLWDQDNRTFTIRADRDQWQLERTYERFAKIEQRYRGWRLVDPAKVLRELAGVAETKLKIEFVDDWPF